VGDNSPNNNDDQLAEVRRQADAARSAAPLASGISRKQEALIAALLTEPTYEQAARKAGVSRRTAHRWLGQPLFQAAYRRARQQLVTAAVARVQSLAVDAVETLASVMRSGAKDSDRLRAATALLEIVLRDWDSADRDDSKPTPVQQLLATAEGRELVARMSDLLAGRPIIQYRIQPPPNEHN
jgi:hypothetical protein